MHANSRAAKLASAMKVFVGMCAPTTDCPIVEDLSMSVPVRARKMVNYACAGQNQGKL